MVRMNTFTERDCGRHAARQAPSQGRAWRAAHPELANGPGVREARLPQNQDLQRFAACRDRRAISGLRGQNCAAASLLGSAEQERIQKHPGLETA